MRKIYVLILVCLFSVKSFGATWYLNGASSDVTVLTNWSSTFPVASATHPASFASPTDIWLIQTNGHILGNVVWTVGGTVIIQTVGGSLLKVGSGASTMNIGGSFIMNDTTHISTAVIPYDLTINLSGNLFVSGYAYMYTTGQANIHIHFVDNTGIPGVPATYKQISWTSTNFSRNTSLTFDKGCVRHLATNVHIPGYSKINDSLNGTLYCDGNTMSGGDSVAFFIGDSAAIYTAHPGGLDSSIQMHGVDDSIWYSSRANYIYNGTVPQVTGFTLPDTLVGPAAIVPYLSSKYGTVTVNNPAGVTISDHVDFEKNAVLNLVRGTMSNGTLLTMNDSSWVKVDSGTLGASPTYFFPVTVQYTNLGPNYLSPTTGNELIPTSTGTIGLFNIHKNGATVSLGSSPVVQTVQIDSLGSSLAGIPVLDASVSNYNITTNLWINYPGTGAFNPRNATVNFVPGPVPVQSLIEGATSFYNLNLNNGNGLALTNAPETVNNQLTLTNGKFYLVSDTLILSNTALPVAGAFSNANMIVDNYAGGNGRIVWQLASDATYMFPVGDSVNYSPITLIFAGNTYGSGTFASPIVHAQKQPNNANTTNYLKRYWSLISGGFIAGPSYTVSAQYVYPLDVFGTENKLSMGQFTGPSVPWNRFSPTNTTTHTLNTTVLVNTAITPNDFTGIDSTRPTVISSHDTIVCIPLPAPGFALTASGATGDPGYSYSWAPSAGLSATTGVSVNANPVISTVYTLTITDGNGFTNTARTSVTVNPAPSVTSAVSNSPLCVGDSLILIGTLPTNVATFAWTGPVALLTPTTNVASAGNVGLAANGTYTLTLTNGPGANCSRSFTVPVVVNALPPNTVATGGGTFCDSAVISATVTPAAGGTVYFQGTTPNGTSTAQLSPQTVFTSGTYYFRAQNGSNCWGNQDSVTVVINPLPNQYYFTPLAGSGAFCTGDTGLHIILSGSDTGVSYQLYALGAASGSPVIGNGGAVDFGLRTDSAWYVLKATNIHTTCGFSNMDSVLVNKIPLPADQTVSGDAGYCLGGIGVDISLTSSNFADSYWVYHNGVAIDSGYNGFGGSVDFGYQTDPGIYTFSAKDVNYGCVSNISMHDSVWINPLPNVYHVFGGGTFCAGGTGFDVAINNSDIGTTYQLLLDGVPPTSSLTSTAHDTLHFGSQTGGGLYTVFATTSLGCVDTMQDSAVINVNPLPYDQPVIQFGGSYCVNDTVASTIGLGLSQTGINYQLYYNGTTAIGTPWQGTGAPISFGTFTDTGTYNVQAIDTLTGCTALMLTSATITIHYLPAVDTLTGTGSFCTGSTGIDVKLNNSEAGVKYTLLYGGAAIDSITSAAIGALDFGIKTGMGAYKAIATSTFGCIDTMAGGSTITVLPLPDLQHVTGGGAHCFPGISFAVGLDSSQAGVTYQLFRNDTDSVSNLTGTGLPLNYGMYNNAGTYTIVATRTATGCKDTMLGNAVIIIHPLPLVDTVSGGGVFCAGAPGAPINLSGSEVGVNYQLYKDGAVVTGALLAGTGIPFSYGLDTAGGTFTVVATNASTGCVRNMAGQAVNVRHLLPTIYTIAGGGGYCAGGPGLPIYLDASSVGKSYQLFNTTGPVGAPLPGTGFGLSYGIFPTPDTYHIVATDTATGCVSNMAGTVTINQHTLPMVDTVSGGGNGCVGSSFAINLSNSSVNVRYKLWNGGTTFMDSLNGTGGPLNFGPQSAGGNYTVTAIDVATLCSSNMYGVATIGFLPTPRVDTITGGGAFCAGGIGVLMGCDSSQIGVNYQLQLGGLPIGGPQVGTGNAISFGYQTLAGTYRIWALNVATTCMDSMYGNKTVVIEPLPNNYSVTGGGSYCTSDTGVHVGLSGSDTGVVYKLYNASGFVGSPLTGDSGPLDFGLETATGVYKVTALNTRTSCYDTMTSGAVVGVIPITVPTVTLKAFPDTIVHVGQPDTLVAIVGSGGPHPSFQWYINGNRLIADTTDTLNFVLYFDEDTITCDVTSDGYCGGITTTKLIVVRLKVDAVPQINRPGSDIHLAPNPNKGVFTLKGTLGSAATEDVYIEVTDMLGQMVYSAKTTAQNGVVDERIKLDGHLANGMYLLNLRSGTEHTVFHFVVEQ